MLDGLDLDKEEITEYVGNNSSFYCFITVDSNNLTDKSNLFLFKIEILKREKSRLIMSLSH